MIRRATSSGRRAVCARSSLLVNRGERGRILRAILLARIAARDAHFRSRFLRYALRSDFSCSCTKNEIQGGTVRRQITRFVIHTPPTPTAAFCDVVQFGRVISITRRRARARARGARLSRWYSFLNPFQRIIHDTDN